MAVPYSLRRYKESLGMFCRGHTTIHMGDTHACVVNLREREKCGETGGMCDIIYENVLYTLSLWDKNL